MAGSALEVYFNTYRFRCCEFFVRLCRNTRRRLQAALIQSSLLRCRDRHVVVSPQPRCHHGIRMTSCCGCAASLMSRCDAESHKRDGCTQRGYIPQSFTRCFCVSGRNQKVPHSLELLKNVLRGFGAAVPQHRPSRTHHLYRVIDLILWREQYHVGFQRNTPSITFIIFFIDCLSTTRQKSDVKKGVEIT